MWQFMCVCVLCVDPYGRGGTYGATDWNKCKYWDGVIIRRNSEMCMMRVACMRGARERDAGWVLCMGVHVRV
jgi:hypothetical protein